MKLQKILVANRGEIARRIFRTCREMGIATVAVYSDADENAWFVREADEAVRIGPAPSLQSYLAADRIVEAALRVGAQAVHPGYGFLSENAGFAERCRLAGLVFIGPSPEAIKQMGDKISAKQFLAGRGIPVVPGDEGKTQSADRLKSAAQAMGFPVLLKASAGGGGKGMRVVRSAAEWDAAWEGARREAKNAFGDERLLLEKYIEKARHVEVQIFGDSQGNYVHLFERDCSLQRRHQKVLEESPAPGLPDEVRQGLAETALKVARAIQYTGAGTVEFVVDPAHRFYFLEMNTRLQVEHPVTEMITGVDLVRWQIEVAQGQPIPLQQSEIKAHGHAVEVRLYAEDAERDFLPVGGTVVDWKFPAGEGLRLESGVQAGSVIGVHYDPMLAKVCAHGKDRESALARLQWALQHMSVLGLQTNLGFLAQLVADPNVRAGAVSTGFIEQNRERWQAKPAPEMEVEAAIAATLHAALSNSGRRKVLPGVAAGFRNNPASLSARDWKGKAQTLHVAYRPLSDGDFQVEVAHTTRVVRVLDWAPQALRWTLDGVQREFRVATAGARVDVKFPSATITLQEVPRFPVRVATESHGGVLAPMTGKVMKLLTSKGKTVQAGDPILVLEAMKMEQTVRAMAMGKVTAVRVREGEMVTVGFAMVDISPLEETAKV